MSAAQALHPLGDVTICRMYAVREKSLRTVYVPAQFVAYRRAVLVRSAKSALVGSEDKLVRLSTLIAAAFIVVGLLVAEAAQPVVGLSGNRGFGRGKPTWTVRAFNGRHVVLMSAGRSATVYLGLHECHMLVGSHAAGAGRAPRSSQVVVIWSCVKHCRHLGPVLLFVLRSVHATPSGEHDSHCMPAS